MCSVPSGCADGVPVGVIGDAISINVYIKFAVYVRHLSVRMCADIHTIIW